MMRQPIPRLTALFAGAALGAFAAPGAAAEEPQAQAGAYVIVHAPQLREAALAWAAYRREGGWTVELVAVEPGEEAGDTREQLRDRIRALHADRPNVDSPFAVLLLGDAGDQAVPTWLLPQPDPMLHAHRSREYATDHPYQLADDADDIPDFALGRIPAATNEEARAVLEKIKRYEQSDAPGPWRRRITYVAGEGGFGAVDVVLEKMFKRMIKQIVPSAFDISMTYASASSIYCPPPSELSDTVLDRLGEGSLLFNYIGHGYASGFGRMQAGGKRHRILVASDLQRLKSDGDRLPIALLTCCSAGWYDLPDGKRSLAEEMLFHPGGPVAVIAGSRPTHPYANAVFQKDITKLLLVDRAPTVGELDLRACQSMTHIDDMDRQIDRIARPIAVMSGVKTPLNVMRETHVHLYNLLGDPAMRIAHAEHLIDDFKLEANVVSGSIAGMKRGRVIITVETPRDQPARRSQLQKTTGEDDPDLESKASQNYAIANDVVLQRFEGHVIDGRFAVPIESPERDASIIKAYASGADERDHAMEAMGAMEAGNGQRPGSRADAAWKTLFRAIPELR